MTEDQIQKLRSLAYAVQTIRREAEEHYLPYKVAAAIASAEDQSYECIAILDGGCGVSAERT